MQGRISRETQFTDAYLVEVFGSKTEDDLVYSEDLRKALVKRIRFSDQSIRSLVFFNGDDNVVISAMDNTIRVWRLWDRQLLHTFIDMQGLISQVRVTKDAKQVIGAGMDSRLYVWDLHTTQPVWSREADFSLLCCDISHDSNLIVTGSDVDHTILFWDRRTGEVVYGLANLFTGSVTKTIFSPDGNRLAACALDGPAKLYDLRSRRTVLTFHDDSVLLSGLAFSKDSRNLVTSAMNSRLNLYDLATGTALKTVLPVCLTCCDFSNFESEFFSCASADGRVFIFDGKFSDRIENIFNLKSHDGCITDCVFSPTGKYLMTTCVDGTGHLWSIDDLKNTK